MIVSERPPISKISSSKAKNTRYEIKRLERKIKKLKLKSCQKRKIYYFSNELKIKVEQYIETEKVCN